MPDAGSEISASTILIQHQAHVYHRAFLPEHRHPIRVEGSAFAVPLLTRILEGLRFSPEDKNLDRAKIPSLLGNALGNVPFYLVADAYYASGAFALSLVAMNGHLVTRAKGNAVAYRPVHKSDKPQRGRPRIYGKKVSLKALSKESPAFVEAESPVYGERGVKIRYREVVLLWKPLGKAVKFVIVKHPTREKRGRFLSHDDGP